MSLLPPRFDFGPTPADGGFGFASAVPSLAASQRASLGRGIAFVLLLAASSLASVYVPRALQGPDWVEGTAPGPLVAGR
jgi:hypothetical protein